MEGSPKRSRDEIKQALKRRYSQAVNDCNAAADNYADAKMRGPHKGLSQKSEKIVTTALELGYRKGQIDLIFTILSIEAITPSTRLAIFEAREDDQQPSQPGREEPKDTASSLEPDSAHTLTQYFTQTTTEDKLDGLREELISEYLIAAARREEAIETLLEAGLSDDQEKLVYDALQAERRMAERGTDILWDQSLDSNLDIAPVTAFEAYSNKKDRRDNRDNGWQIIKKPEEK